MTLLELIQSCTRRLGLSVPSVVISNTESYVLELLNCANDIGIHMTSTYDWQRTRQYYVFETTAEISRSGTISAAGVITGLSSTSDLSVGMIVEGTGVQSWSEIASVDSSSQVTLNLSATAGSSITFTFKTQDYALPSDYDHIAANTNYDRTNYWDNKGPLSDQAWSRFQSGLITDGPRLRYQIFNNKLRLTPPPSEKLTQSFIYYSKNWILASGGTSASKSEFTADADTFIYDDLLMKWGTMMIWRQSKGLDANFEAGMFDNYLSNRKAVDSPPQDKSLSPIQPSYLISGRNAPETGFGS